MQIQNFGNHIIHTKKRFILRKDGNLELMYQLSITINEDIDFVW